MLKASKGGVHTVRQSKTQEQDCHHYCSGVTKAKIINSNMDLFRKVCRIPLSLLLQSLPFLRTFVQAFVFLLLPGSIVRMISSKPAHLYCCHRYCTGNHHQLHPQWGITTHPIVLVSMILGSPRTVSNDNRTIAQLSLAPAWVRCH